MSILYKVVKLSVSFIDFFTVQASRKQKTPELLLPHMRCEFYRKQLF
jgi:hypothetical protein